MIIWGGLCALFKKLRYLFLSFLLVNFLGSCIPLKSVFLGHPDSKDHDRFRKASMDADSCFNFTESPIHTPLFINDWTSDKPEFKTVQSVCEEHAVRAFILIQNDTIKFEYYADGLGRTSLHSSYSLAKSFVSCLVGIAIDEGFIKNVDQKVVDFLPEIPINEKSKLLTIRHLLNHTSGMKFSLIQDGRLYYGNDLKSELGKIQFESSPGEKQEYLNMNSQLLGIIINRSCKESVSAFAHKRLWAPINMCYNGFWSVDHSSTEKSFCCLSATALDYAKFGRLYLNKGKWNGKHIFSERWYNQSICRDTTEGSSYNFNYSWHIGLSEYEDFMAIGLYKQHIYVSPKKNIIMVLLNDRENKVKAERINWWYIFRQVVDQL